MKTLLTLFILLFSSSVLADDIRDFQIEGMSVGDSLLDHFSEEEINKELENSFIHRENKFIIIDFIKSNFNIYEKVQIILKPNDKNYIIYGVEGLIESFQDINECINIKDKIAGELNNLFKNIGKITIEDERHPYDKSGNTMVYSVYHTINSGGKASVECYDWSQELEDKEGWKDDVRVSVISEEYRIFLKSAY